MLNLKNKIPTGKSRCLQSRLEKSQVWSRGLGAYLMKNLVGIKFMMDNLIIQPAFFLFVPRSILQGKMTKLIIILITLI